MSSKVFIDLDVEDSFGDLVDSGLYYIYPTTQVTDPGEGITITTEARGAAFDGTLASAEVYATDNPSMSPAGWSWFLDFSQNPVVPGKPTPIIFFAPAGPCSFTATSASPAVFTWSPTAAFTQAFGTSGLPNGTAVTLAGGSLPAGFSAATTYFVVGTAATTFNLAATKGGSAIASTGTGSGTFTVTRYTYSGLVPQAPVNQVSTYLKTGSNLADLPNLPAARNSLGVAIPDSEKRYLVSTAASASDSNDGLAPGSAKATIAGALAAANGSPCFIQLGHGTFTINNADLNGNAVTLPAAGTVLAGLSPQLTKVSVNCATTFGIVMQAALSEVRDLTLATTAGGTVTYGAGVDTPTSTGSAESCKLTRVTVQGNTGTVTWGFAVGPTHTGVGSVDLAQTIFTNCSATACATGGFNVGNGTGGNILDTYFYGCNSQGNGSYGIFSSGTTWHWYGGTFQKNGVADISLGNGSKLVTAQGFRSENSTRLLQGSGGGTNNVSLRDIIWQGGDGSTGPAQSPLGDFINYALPGTLNLDNVQVQAFKGSGVVPCFLLGTAVHPLTVNVTGLAAEAPLSQLFSAAPTQFVTAFVTGYVQLDNTTGFAIDSVTPPPPTYLTPSSTLFNFNGTSRDTMVPVTPSAVFSPRSFGAVGNGTADDTTAVKAAFAAALAAGGCVDLGTSTFLTTSPVTLTSPHGIRVTGAQGSGGLKNATSDLFTVTGTCSFVTFDNVALESRPGGGHIFNGSSAPNCAIWRINGCNFTQDNPAKAIWFQTGGTYIDCLTGQNTTMTCALARRDAGCATTLGSTTVTDPEAVSGDVGLPVGSGHAIPFGTTISAVTPGTGYTLSAAATATATGLTFCIGGATVAPWTITGVAGAMNSLQFERLRCTGNYSPAVPFFNLDNGSTAGFSANIIFKSITFEVCMGGSVNTAGCYQVVVDECAHWDGEPSTSTFSFNKSTAGYPCRSVIVRQSLNIHANANAPDIFCDPLTSGVVLDSNGSWGVPATYSSPAAQTTVLNPVSLATSPVATFPGPVAVGGNTGATAGTRLAGGTVHGAPVSGTYLTGDVVTDQTGVIWVCTAGGTPGTWVSSGGTASSDVQFFTTVGNFTWTKPTGAVKVKVVLGGAGAGGGSGAVNPSASVSGGAGGGGGPVLSRDFVASDLTATVTGIVAAGGTGGASVTGTTATPGNAGGAGGTTTFGAFAFASLGTSGAGGTTATAAAGVGGLGTAVGGTGGAGLVGVAGNGTNPAAGGGGGAGGGGATATSAGNGNVSQASYSASSVNVGRAGTTTGTLPTGGTQPTVQGSPSCGGGGGAGAFGAGVTAQSGASAFFCGGGGGGGSAVGSGTLTSGAGGNGGQGFALIITEFS